MPTAAVDALAEADAGSVVCRTASSVCAGHDDAGCGGDAAGFQTAEPLSTVVLYFSELVAARHGYSLRTCSRPQLMAELFKSITHVRLDRAGLISLPHNVVQQLPAVTNWNLQHNQLTSLSALENATSAKLICAAHNHLTAMPNLDALTCLICLDLSFNSIGDITPSHLPKRLVFLQLDNNPGVLAAADTGADLHAHLSGHLPNLQMLRLTVGWDASSTDTLSSEDSVDGEALEADRHEHQRPRGDAAAALAEANAGAGATASTTTAATKEARPGFAGASPSDASEYPVAGGLESMLKAMDLVQRGAIDRLELLERGVWSSCSLRAGRPPGASDRVQSQTCGDTKRPRCHPEAGRQAPAAGPDGVSGGSCPGRAGSSSRCAVGGAVQPAACGSAVTPAPQWPALLSTGAAGGLNCGVMERLSRTVAAAPRPLLGTPLAQHTLATASALGPVATSTAASPTGQPPLSPIGRSFSGKQLLERPMPPAVELLLRERSQQHSLLTRTPPPLVQQPARRTNTAMSAEELRASVAQDLQHLGDMLRRYVEHGVPAQQHGATAGDEAAGQGPMQGAVDALLSASKQRLQAQQRQSEAA